MKKIYIAILIILGTIGLYSASESLLATNTTTIAKNTDYIVTVTNVTMGTDSTGINLNFDKDSLSGYITYAWVTADGNISPTTYTFTLDNGSTTFTNTGDKKTVFTEKMNRIAGGYRANVYLYLHHHKNSAATQTITTKVRKVTW